MVLDALHTGDRIRLELAVPEDEATWTGAQDLIKPEIG